MPPSASKRPQRAKRQLPVDSTDDVDPPNTSPTQSSKRRRTREQPAPAVNALPKTQAELDISHEDLVSTVSQHLLLPKHMVQVAIDNDNDQHQRQSKNVSAYAKITGQNWTFYVKRLSTNIGRPPEGFVPPNGDVALTPAASNEGLELPAAPTESSRIHIDLGPNKLVSRLHAEIFFDSQTASWNILVNGRNGIKIDDQLLRRGQQSRLSSGRVIEIGGVEMMFVLPENEETVVVRDRYLRRAGLIQQDPYEAAEDNKNPNQLSNNTPYLGIPGQLAIAPAPPDYRKPDTPIKPRSKGPPSTHSPAFNNAGGTMMTSSDSIDFSLEQNADIKPAYTYSQLITQALLCAPGEQDTLIHIYEYCMKNFAFYRRKEFQKGWQNSIRHNLSLHPGFTLKPRDTNEPGKGGYWCIKKSFRDSLVDEAWGGKGTTRKSPTRRSPQTSSTPLPSAMNGRKGHGPGDVAGGSPTRKMKRSPSSRSPTMGSRGPQFTPDHRNNLASSLDSLPEDGSPLPRYRRGVGLSDNMHGSPPALPSSFAGEEGNSLVTPAPVRRHPYLAPPSTAQRPSQHMPTSSPAPFWRYADVGPTPIKGSTFDLSPIKIAKPIAAVPQSSSPAPRHDINDSPSKNPGELKNEKTTVDDSIDEEPAFDLTKPFMEISKYHTASNNSLPVSAAGKSQA